MSYFSADQEKCQRGDARRSTQRPWGPRPLFPAGRRRFLAGLAGRQLLGHLTAEGLYSCHLFPPHPEVTRTAVPKGRGPVQKHQREKEKARGCRTAKASRELEPRRHLLNSPGSLVVWITYWIHGFLPYSHPTRQILSTLWVWCHLLNTFPYACVGPLTQGNEK